MATADQFVWDIADIDTTDLTRFGGKGTGLARMAGQGFRSRRPSLSARMPTEPIGMAEAACRTG